MCDLPNDGELDALAAVADELARGFRLPPARLVHLVPSEGHEARRRQALRARKFVFAIGDTVVLLLFGVRVKSGVFEFVLVWRNMVQRDGNVECLGEQQ